MCPTFLRFVSAGPAPKHSQSLLQWSNLHFVYFKLQDLLQEEYQTLTKDNETLKTKVKQLHKENCTFLRNISSLYQTAKNEIEKKNFIIKNLTEK